MVFEYEELLSNDGNEPTREMIVCHVTSHHHSSSRKFLESFRAKTVARSLGASSLSSLAATSQVSLENVARRNCSGWLQVLCHPYRDFWLRSIFQRHYGLEWFWKIEYFGRNLFCSWNYQFIASKPISRRIEKSIFNILILLGPS
jgi:hypothetical protein